MAMAASLRPHRQAVAAVAAARPRREAIVSGQPVASAAAPELACPSAAEAAVST